MRSISPLPPRGMITSTNCGMAISWPTAFGGGLQHLGAELEAVHHGLGQAVGHSALQVFGVVDLQRSHVLTQQAGQRLERFVFDSCWRFGHQRRGRFGLETERMRVFGDVESVHPAILPHLALPLRPCPTRTSLAMTTTAPAQLVALTEVLQ